MLESHETLLLKALERVVIGTCLLFYLSLIQEFAYFEGLLNPGIAS